MITATGLSGSQDRSWSRNLSYRGPYYRHSLGPPRAIRTWKSDERVFQGTWYVSWLRAFVGRQDLVCVLIKSLCMDTVSRTHCLQPWSLPQPLWAPTWPTSAIDDRPDLTSLSPALSPRGSLLLRPHPSCYLKVKVLVLTSLWHKIFFIGSPPKAMRSAGKAACDTDRKLRLALDKQEQQVQQPWDWSQTSLG